MRRHGYGVSEEVLMNLIREVFLMRAPEQLQLIAKLRREPLASNEREAIREVLADELLDNGLGPDDEPDERGRLIEAAIDWLGQR